MSAGFTAACIQFTAGPDPEPNLRQVSELIRQARAAGADLIMTPEVSNFIESGRRRRDMRLAQLAVHLPRDPQQQQPAGEHQTGPQSRVLRPDRQTDRAHRLGTAASRTGRRFSEIVTSATTTTHARDRLSRSDGATAPAPAPGPAPGARTARPRSHPGPRPRRLPGWSTRW